jgi:preprotein translocase subunit SecF
MKSNLMKLKPIFFGISLVFLIPSIISLIVFGLKPNIDFTGGSLLELKIQDQSSINVQEISEQVKPVYEVESVQPSENDQYILRGPEISNPQKQEILTILKQRYQTLEEVRFESVGPILGKELVFKTVIAVLIVSILIILYVWHQFDELKFGVCAVSGMFHDSLILLGTYSLLGHFYGIEVDVLFVTALLTTLSFSIHDTIVIYDRIRELKHDQPKLDLEQTANLAVWETLARSINNSITIILMLAALVLLGGSTIRWFVVALLIGAVAGTYSSTFTAVPLLVLWEEIENRNS